MEERHRGACASSIPLVTPTLMLCCRDCVCSTMMDLQRLASVKAGPRIRGRVVFEEVYGMQGPIDPDSNDSSSGSDEREGEEEGNLEGNARSTALIGTPDDDQHDAAEAQTHVPTPRGSSRSSSSRERPPLKVRMGGVQGVIGGGEGRSGGGYEPLRTLPSKEWKELGEGVYPPRICACSCARIRACVRRACVSLCVRVCPRVRACDACVRVLVCVCSCLCARAYVCLRTACVLLV